MSVISGSDCGAMCHVSVETKIIDNISAGQDTALYGCFFYGHLENNLTYETLVYFILLCYSVQRHGYIWRIL